VIHLLSKCAAVQLLHNAEAAFTLKRERAVSFPFLFADSLLFFGGGRGSCSPASLIAFVFHSKTARASVPIQLLIRAVQHYWWTFLPSSSQSEKKKEKEHNNDFTPPLCSFQFCGADGNTQLRGGLLRFLLFFPFSLPLSQRKSGGRKVT
jgi:hypothetical protein